MYIYICIYYSACLYSGEKKKLRFTLGEVEPPLLFFSHSDKGTLIPAFLPSINHKVYDSYY